MIGLPFLVSLAIATLSTQTPQPTLLLGVLEEPQGSEDGHCGDGKPVSVAVRLLYAKRENEWTPLTAQERRGFDRLSWTVAFDGRNLGTIRTEGPLSSRTRTWGYLEGLWRVAPGQHVPSVPNRSGLFGGWCRGPAVRPLVLVSRPHFADPDRWKPFQPTPGDVEALFSRFKAKAGAASKCPRDSERYEPYRYAAPDLVVHRSYQDGTGRKLINLGLNPDTLRTCDDPGEAGDTQWFLLGPDTLHVGTNLTVIDAGDYDADGRSEVLFWKSGYNEDGYVLVYDGFRRRATYTWTYH